MTLEALISRWGELVDTYDLTDAEQIKYLIAGLHTGINSDALSRIVDAIETAIARARRQATQT